ncbi:MAG: hypothetical protein FD167_87 [bacterium]|nr:MAG: hypothetical protein FD167_87 [bacterium]
METVEFTSLFSWLPNHLTESPDARYRHRLLKEELIHWQENLTALQSFVNNAPYLADHKPLLEKYLIIHPTAKLQDLCDLIKKQVGIEVGCPHMSDVVKKLGLPYTKTGNQGKVSKKAIS